ncbi:putative diphthamide synthesis DPH1/DPH2 [Septoria linicola]|nr:putative diphthamide synthesis DPH1/DPH2 [Septoria linicola]
MAAPVLSTPSEQVFQEAAPLVVQSSEDRLSEEQLYVQYEIRRTIDEIRVGKWKRIALQFPDDMLVDAPRVFERLRDGLKKAREQANSHQESTIEDLSAKLEHATIDAHTPATTIDEIEERLCILGDTSYGACCVDEVAAEHTDAEVVVHYGRSCLSPTARLPVIYVFTAKALNLDSVVASFKQTYQDQDSKVCLMADIPYSHHLDELHTRLAQEGYTQLFKTEILHDPASPIPNRTTPPDTKDNAEALKDYSIFHISEPPTSLLLILSSRIKSMHIFPTTSPSTITTTIEASTTHLLRRRYALITRLASTPIFGILINTLSVRNYLSALQHCQSLISRAGKKAYVFVVGKVNAAKIANFSEIGGWVVIGCWESSLIESKEFYRPIITPFELKLALQADGERVWGGEWVGDFGQLLGRDGEGRGGEVQQGSADARVEDDEAVVGEEKSDVNWDDQPSDDEPPEFDLRTGQYVSHSRPMGRRQQPQSLPTNSNDPTTTSSPVPPTFSSALIQRTKDSSLASINGQISPAAEFLRNKRTWQGLGSDFDIAYERDEEGKIIGAAMEEGRSGVAKGYHVGEDLRKG